MGGHSSRRGERERKRPSGGVARTYPSIVKYVGGKHPYEKRDARERAKGAAAADDPRFGRRDFGNVQLAAKRDQGNFVRNDDSVGAKMQTCDDLAAEGFELGEAVGEITAENEIGEQSEDSVANASGLRERPGS